MSRELEVVDVGESDLATSYCSLVVDGVIPPSTSRAWTLGSPPGRFSATMVLLLETSSMA